MGFESPRSRAWLTAAVLLLAAAFVFGVIAVNGAYVRSTTVEAASCVPSPGNPAECISDEPGSGAWPWVWAVAAAGSLMLSAAAFRHARREKQVAVST
jgi:hypothetical protein